MVETLPNMDSENSGREIRRRSRDVKALETLRESEFVQDVEKAYGSIDHLRDVSGRPPLGTYLRRIWQRRHFIWWESKSKVETENIGNRLGSFWLILRPLLDAAFYWIIFGLLLNMSRGMDNYVAFVIIGVFMFQFTSSAINNGVKLIKSNRSMIRAFQFPRASLAVASLVHNFLQRVPATIMMFLIIMAIPPHELPELIWLLFPIVLALQLTMDFGIYLVFARLGHMMPDFAKAMSFFSRIIMYGSGVIFPIDRFLGNPTVMAIMEMNPIYQVLMMYRNILIDGTLPDVTAWLVVGGWALGLFIFGFVFFWLGEESYGREQR